jgi:sigma-B regulation protein RsbU (phosphoserine phosphatase)
MVVRGDGSTLRLMHHGPVLGIFQKAAFPTEKASLMPGDALVLYTDGVIELRDPQGDEFGMDRLAEAVHRSLDLTAGGILQSIIQTTRQFAGSERYEDDFTLVVVKRLKGAKSGQL